MPQRIAKWSKPGALVALIVAVAAAGAWVTRGDASSAAPAPRAAASSAAAATIVVRAANVDALPSIEAHAAALGYVARRGDPALPSLALDAPAGVDAAQAIGAFITYPGVIYAEPAYTMALADTPSDSLFPKQTYLDKVGAPKAWDTETGDPSVIVAVLDTGVDINHADLAGRIWNNSDEIPSNGIDDDNSGCIDDLHGCSFVTLDLGCTAPRNGNIRDDAGHGTFVAGIIGANANGRGIVGVARGVTLMPVKVLDCNGGGTSVDVSIGVLYAARNGARVINISLGGNFDSLLLREAVRIAHDEFGALIVAATGNTGSEGVLYPARYDIALAVGAAAANGTSRAPFTTTGPEVDVAAIGVDIIGTVPADSCNRFLPCISNSPYAMGSGTSFSAPQASGLAALILSRRPFMTADQVAEQIRSTADAVPQGGANWAGKGRINMAAALKPGFRLGSPGTTRD